jgi:hypothetical protein
MLSSIFSYEFCDAAISIVCKEYVFPNAASGETFSMVYYSVTLTANSDTYYLSIKLPN